MCRELSSWYVVFFYPKIVEYYKKLFKIIYFICYLLQKYIFFTKNLSICIFCSTFAANIPFSEYGLGCPRLEGLSVLAVLFFLMRYQFYPNLFHIFAVNIIFYCVICQIWFVRIQDVSSNRICYQVCYLQSYYICFFR